MHWKLGFLIGTPIGVILAAAFTIAAVLVWRWGTQAAARDPLVESRFDVFTFYRMPALALIIGALAAAGITAGANIPFKAEYLQWRPVTGVAQSIDSRFNSRDSGVSETYVITVNDQPYRVDDNRAITLEEGDHVSLMCTREWQWAASDGYSCRWGE